MAIENNTYNKILMILLKGPFAVHTATSIAHAVGITRQGAWKALSKLEENKLIILKTVGDSRTSIATIKLNWDNPVTEKMLSLLLTEESLRHQRWAVNFSGLRGSVKFLIIFGSILINTKEANDIDLLAIVDRKKFRAVEDAIAKAQLTQIKKIHLIDLTEDELGNELRKPNKAYIDAIKKGAVIYGQDNFIQFMRGVQR